MPDLKDFITLGGKPYNELSELGKNKYDKFIQGIKEAGIENKLLTFVGRKYDVSPSTGEFNEVHTNNLPPDLSDELDKIWVNLPS